MSAVRIAIHGWSGSGKSEICRYLAQTHGLTIASTGSICREITAILFGTEDRYLLNKVSTAMRQIRRDIWIEAVLRNTSSDRLVFDSVRYATDIEVLRNAGFEIWSITCPKEVAEKRLISRGQVFNPADLTHESEVALANGTFDVLIDNGDRNWVDVSVDIDAAVAAFGRDR